MKVTDRERGDRERRWKGRNRVKEMGEKAAGRQTDRERFRGMEAERNKKSENGRKILLQRHCTESLKQIFPEIKLCGLVPYSYIHVPVSDLYILRILGISKSLTVTDT